MKSAALALVGGLLLASATWSEGSLGPWVVLPALMVWFAVATATQRPVWCSYLLGAVHMAVVAWSVRHIMLPVYGFIVVVGAAYYALATCAVRAAPRRWAALAFAIATAASFWLRGAMPEIYYPHGQPCHALWRQPVLLSAVVVGGEPLANACLAGLAAATVNLWRSWRVAAPPWAAARRDALVALSVAGLVTVVGCVLHRTACADGADSVRIAAIEPGFHPMRELGGRSREDTVTRTRQLLAERLVQPTRAELRRAPAPDLVLWPESSWPPVEPLTAIESGRHPLLPDVLPASAARLLLGGNVHAPGQPSTPAAFLLQLPEGRVVAHQEKLWLVPGGEFPPFLGFLPATWSGWLIEQFERAMGSLPNAAPGRLLPPLQTAAGVPFGMLMCYDNAFAGPAQWHVRAGARFLCVLSNESWFEAGDELFQLAAMTVVRALETATPLVRCTQDGYSLAVAADGRVLVELPVLASPQPAARILRVELPLGSGRLPPMAWSRAAAGPAVGLLLLAMLTHGLWRWAKLGTARTASRPVGSTGDPGRAHGSGS